MSEQHIELVRQGYEAWNRGDIAAVIDLTHPEFEWTGSVEVVGTRPGAGRSDFEAYLSSFADVWREFRSEPEWFQPVGDVLLVVVRERARGKLSGAPVQRKLVHLWSFRDGRAVRLEVYARTREALERLSHANGRERRSQLSHASLARR